MEKLKNENKKLLSELSIIKRNVKFLSSYRKLCSKLIENCVCDGNLDNENEFNFLEINYEIFLNQNVLKTNQKCHINENSSKNTENIQSNEIKRENNETQDYKITTQDCNEDNYMSEDCETDNEIIEINQTLNENGEPIEPIQELIIGDSFEFSSALMIQKLTDESLPKYLCETQGCNTFFTSLELFYAHKRTHRLNNSFASNYMTGEKSFKSNNSLISNGYTGEISLKSNDSIVSSDGEQPLQLTYSDTTYGCDYNGCPYVTKQKHDLTRHRKVHFSVIERYVCDWPSCGLRYKDKCHLTAHYRIHTGEKPFLCQWSGCGKRFRIKDLLRKHELTHSGVKNFGCSKCGKFYSRKDKLNQHKCIIEQNYTIKSELQYTGYPMDPLSYELSYRMNQTIKPETLAIETNVRYPMNSLSYEPNVKTIPIEANVKILPSYEPT